MAQTDDADESSPLDELPPEVIEALPADIVEKLENGTLDQIPSETMEKLTPDVADKVPVSLAEAASDNPGLTVVLVLIGIAAIAGAVWGAIKGFLKVAVLLGLIALAAWYFTLR